MPQTPAPSARGSFATWLLMPPGDVSGLFTSLQCRTAGSRQRGPTLPWGVPFAGCKDRYLSPPWRAVWCSLHGDQGLSCPFWCCSPAGGRASASGRGWRECWLSGQRGLQGPVTKCWHSNFFWSSWLSSLQKRQLIRLQEHWAVCSPGQPSHTPPRTATAGAAPLGWDPPANTCGCNGRGSPTSPTNSLVFQHPQHLVLVKKLGNQMAISKTLAKIKDLRELMQPGWVFWEVASMLRLPLSPQQQKHHHQRWFSLTAEDADGSSSL